MRARRRRRRRAGARRRRGRDRAARGRRTGRRPAAKGARRRTGSRGRRRAERAAAGGSPAGRGPARRAGSLHEEVYLLDWLIECRVGLWHRHDVLCWVRSKLIHPCFKEVNGVGALVLVIAKAHEVYASTDNLHLFAVPSCQVHDAPNGNAWFYHFTWADMKPSVGYPFFIKRSDAHLFECALRYPSVAISEKLACVKIDAKVSMCP